jgi:hypothetical protein
MFPYLHGVFGSAAAPWTPASPTTDGGVLPHTDFRPGVANFQDAAETTPADEIGDVIGGVVNQGSDSYSISQATTANKPTLQQVEINGVTSWVWLLDGVNDFLQGAFGGGAIAQPFTVFAVAQLDATIVDDNKNHHITDGDASGRLILQKVSTGTPDTWRIYGGAPLQGGAADASWNIWTALFNAASSQFWHNGVSEASGDAGSDSVDTLTVGSNYLGDVVWKGYIGQILIYPGNLSNADKNEVGGFLELATGIAWTTIT